MTLGQTEDLYYKELRDRYGLDLSKPIGIKIVETTQKKKPLQVFPNPAPGREYKITWDTSELTSLCPKTGQPDFCELTVQYIPDKWILELKAVKLYLWSYRNEGHFYEELVNLIYSDFWKALDEPKFLKVTGSFRIRGGIIEEVEIDSDLVELPPGEKA